MKGRDKGASRAENGFTLIELLVAAGVFLLLTVIILQVVVQTSAFTSSGSRFMEASRSARILFDTLVTDLATAVSSYGATILTSKDPVTGDTTIAFLCSGRPDSAISGQPSRMASVFFTVKQEADPAAGGVVPMSVRGFKSLLWGDNMRDALVAIYDASQIDDPAVATDVLADAVIRMEAVFVLTDGKIVAEPPVIAWYGSAQGLDLTKIKALIVSVATLDKKTQKLLLGTDPNGMPALAAALPPVTQDGKTALDVWSAVDLAAFPLPVRQNIRFFQRTVYLP